jgi:hypothetical protein
MASRPFPGGESQKKRTLEDLKKREGNKQFLVKAPKWARVC